MLGRLVALAALLLAALPAAPASAAPIDHSRASVRVLDDDGVVTVAELPTTKIAISPAPEDQRLEMEVGVALQYFDGTDFSHGDTTWYSMVELRRTDPAQDFIMSLQTVGTRPRSGLARLEVLLPTDQPPAHSVYSEPFTIDGAARGTVAATTDSVYPVRDGYLDTTALTLTADEPVVHDLDIVAADGTVVRTFSSDAPRTEQRVTWWGTGPTGTPVAPGDYTARLTMTDATGQVSTASRELSVRPERAVWTTWTRHLTPAQAHKTRRPTIGFCSALRGNVNGWSGAHGFWSNNRCAGTDEYASRVKTIYGSRIPTAGVLEYGDLSVIATGRADASRPRSIGYLSLDRHARHDHPGRRVSSTYGQHSSPVLPADDVMLPDDSIRWRFTVPYSHRWDVRRFTVKVQMRVLR